MSESRYRSIHAGHWELVWKVGLALLLILFIVVGVVTYMKYRKGSLRLELDRTSFREGDTIKGTLNVKARKPLYADEITLSVWCRESWEEMEYRNFDHDRMDSYRDNNEVIYSVPAVLVSGPVDLVKGETKRFEVAIKIPTNIKLLEPSSLRSRSGSYYRGTYSSRDRRPFTRNHRQEWYVGAEFHTAGLNIEDQRSIHVDH